ncbi:MAG: tRNA dihydrouridine synthase DusB [Candidatus Cloacimonetes bacterium]|nr:tRNA dihydrouridine synthase DusB [Candidatus Cloacimonadota bacterium]
MPQTSRVSTTLPDIPLYLAPLAGYTDQAFRKLCKDWSVDFLVSEMVSADGLIRDSRKTIDFIRFSEYERPFVIQLFGSDATIMAKAATFLIDLAPDWVDINMGCPVKKVVKRGAGSALMKDPARASDIVRAVKKALEGRIPLSVKFRSGWDSDSINYLDFGLRMQDAGADQLCLHPRTSRQMFSGLSNWEHIHLLKEALSIPLIGNGDVHSPESAAQMRQGTGCDGIMIGRGALGKPWIFKQIKDFIATGDYAPITKNDLFKTALQHLDYALQNKREDVVVREMRSQLCHYSKGLPGGADLRNKINHCQSPEEIREHLHHFFGHSL